MYAFIFRTVFAHMDPERAHHLVIPVIRAFGVWPLRPIVRALTAPDPSLRTRALGLEFDSPFGVAAGFDKNAVMSEGLYALGFGHVEVGTVTAVPQDGNPRPRLFRLIADRGLINRMGFNNAGAAAAARRLGRSRRRPRRAVLGANIGKSRIVDVEHATADYVTSTKLVAPVADYLVVNVSSPNTPGLRGLQAVETLRPLLEAVRDAAGTTPLLVKIAPDLPDEEVEAVARLAVDLGLAGLVATNTTISREGLTADASAVAAMGAGGLSGAPLRGRALDVLRVVRAVVPDEFCVIAAGGVESAADVQERLDAGATLVQGYTGFIYRGPLWARQINRGLVAGRAR
ncbi:dihydroorotate dehydrogenase (fumarate) [Microbacterium sp. oral taxon 186 str. F0373]|jgi:dihydroorotate dehydrogenase|uniref:quinone-dependent dihydroorotate dehydrogenase n=1 Tax=Microbacterium sp. oral taxon 186 TaxID=712383 RepID=UPI00034E3F4A|nr:quinone-dependent dihydroorotate dehydrogenase [Microbacterium sp. oral taxon 186]EPD83556.1 dihydroorotate dehydrogenase (fumarate) [Microbacterium sp. oral taxon 186 str. F0373]